MKRLLDEFLSMLHLDGRDWAVFLTALLLAFSIWLIHNLSLNYTEFVKVPVVAKCNIEGHSAVSSNKCDVVARCRTSGFNIFMANYSLNRTPKEILFESMHHKSGEIYYVTSADLNEYVHLIYGDIVSLDYFVSDTLFFRFPYEANRRVPVSPVAVFSYEPQYTSRGDLQVEPDSVTIYGEPLHLENIDRVYTEAIKLGALNTSTHGIARIEKIKGIRFSEESVRYSLNVTRYVEIQKRVKVTGRNVPGDKELMIYPSSALVRIKAAFPLSYTMDENLSFYIDYNDFQSSLTGKCMLKSDNLPEGVIGFETEPGVFDCFVDEK